MVWVSVIPTEELRLHELTRRRVGAEDIDLEKVKQSVGKLVQCSSECL
jgi:hypothetical protein